MSVVYDDYLESKRKAYFMKFVHEVELLGLAVDILAICAPPRIGNDIGTRHYTGAGFIPTMRVLGWLIDIKA